MQTRMILSEEILDRLALGVDKIASARLIVQNLAKPLVNDINTTNAIPLLLGNELEEWNTLVKAVNNASNEIVNAQFVIELTQTISKLISKKYKILSLKFHPDKNEDKEKATKDFQDISNAKDHLLGVIEYLNHIHTKLIGYCDKINKDKATNLQPLVVEHQQNIPIKQVRRLKKSTAPSALKNFFNNVGITEIKLVDKFSLLIVLESDDLSLQYIIALRYQYKPKKTKHQGKLFTILQKSPSKKENTITLTFKDAINSFEEGMSLLNNTIFFESDYTPPSFDRNNQNTAHQPNASTNQTQQQNYSNSENSQQSYVKYAQQQFDDFVNNLREQYQPFSFNFAGTNTFNSNPIDPYDLLFNFDNMRSQFNQPQNTTFATESSSQSQEYTNATPDAEVPPSRTDETPFYTSRNNFSFYQPEPNIQQQHANTPSNAPMNPQVPSQSLKRKREDDDTETSRNKL